MTSLLCRPDGRLGVGRQFVDDGPYRPLNAGGVSGRDGFRLADGVADDTGVVMKNLDGEPDTLEHQPRLAHGQ